MNDYKTHLQTFGNYEQSIHSFVNIRDESVCRRVEEDLGRGELWPEPLVQFNPSYEVAGDVRFLTGPGSLHGELDDSSQSYSMFHQQAKAKNQSTA
jgi:hypothetical protein